MAASPRLTVIGLLALAVAAIAGLVVTTAPPVSNLPLTKPSGPAAGRPVVDQMPLAIARQMSALAANNPEEQRFARDVERLADHEVDLAFAGALRAAQEQPGIPTAETRSIEQRIRQAQADIQSDQEEIATLTAQAKKAKADRQDELQQQIEVIQAEVSLDQDELADAQQDRIRAGGDPRGTVQRLFQEHEASEHANTGSVRLDSGPGGSANAPVASLIANWRNYSELRARQGQVLEAQQDSLNRAAALSGEHEGLEKRIEQEQPKQKAAARQTASRVVTTPSSDSGDSRTAATAALSSLRQLSNDEKKLADLDNRIQDLQQLAATYGQWSALLDSRARLARRSVIRPALWILLVVIMALLVQRGIDRFLGRLSLERKRQLTLRALLRFAVQTLAVLVILLVIFGAPSQLSTILGLAGAGLTVALKDFIVSFLGWFVLMGRNGVRVGDWVEINGVRGEVVEIGLLRTVLLETGNWNDMGHPTGRQVAFLNSYAVEGYYFNFTTSGQWLWDSLQVMVPAGENPYPLIEKIRAIAARESESNAQAAEQAWQRVTRRYGVRPLSAAPAVEARLTDHGVEVNLRYMARAGERSEVRSRLNQAILELLHRGQDGAPAVDAVPASSEVR